MTIVLIEDNDDYREMLTEVLAGHFKVHAFESPHGYLMSEVKCDLVLSDWDFGHVTLDFFKDSMDANKLVVLSGSNAIVSVDCRAVYQKNEDLKNLPGILKMLLSR